MDSQLLETLSLLDLIYLGTPYSRYPGGIYEAHKDACRFAGQLLTLGLKVYSPIAHTHSIAIHGNIDPLDHNIWLPFDMAIIRKSDAMIVGQLQGWDTSRGVRYEIEAFKEAGKPVFYLSPEWAQGSGQGKPGCQRGRL